MKSLRERLGEVITVSRPGEFWYVDFMGRHKYPFDKEDHANDFRDKWIARLEEFFNEYIQVAHGEPPLTEETIRSVEDLANDVLSNPPSSRDTVSAHSHLTFIRMIRWQQAVIHTLAKDNGYLEGYEKGRQDEAKEAFKVMQEMVKETAKAIRTM